MCHFFPSRQPQQGGIVVILAVIILVALIGVAALVIDTSRQETAVEQLQTASDAAALAAARMLDGTEQGWKNAKRAAVALLKGKTFFGASSAVNNSFQLDLTGTGIPQDPLEANGSPYTSTQGRAGNLHVTIERGVYWAKESGQNAGKLEFRSLEAQPVSNKTNKPELYTLPVYLIANAVRIQLELENVPTTFAGAAFGEKQFEKLTRQSVSVSDAEVEKCVAPVAIPACALMLDSTPNATQRYNINGYDPRMQCEREVLVTEANHEVYGRFEGYARAASYIRPPYEPSGDYVNQKAIPIPGVLGVPYYGSSSGPATGQDVHLVFANQQTNQVPGGCTKVKLGAGFKPIDAFVDDAGTLIGNFNQRFVDNDQVDQTLADLINNSTSSFGAKFGNPNDPNNSPKPNFPSMQMYQPTKLDPFGEIRQLWPHFLQPTPPPGSCLDSQGKLQQQCTRTYFTRMYMDSRDPAEWTNPMCHSKRISDANDIGSAKVKEMTVMIIAPRATQTPINALPIHGYCDFDSLFNHQEQDAYAPESYTDPVVVGFTTAYFFDFNVMDLTTLFPFQTPSYQHGQGNALREIVDRNSNWGPNPAIAPDNAPTVIDIPPSGNFTPLQGAERYVLDYKEWVKCIAQCNLDPSSCPPDPQSFCQNYVIQSLQNNPQPSAGYLRQCFYDITSSPFWGDDPESPAAGKLPFDPIFYQTPPYPQNLTTMDLFFTDPETYYIDLQFYGEVLEVPVPTLQDIIGDPNRRNLYQSFIVQLRNKVNNQNISIMWQCFLMGGGAPRSDVKTCFQNNGMDPLLVDRFPGHLLDFAQRFNVNALSRIIPQYLATLLQMRDLPQANDPFDPIVTITALVITDNWKARPGIHCLPAKRDDCFPDYDPSCWFSPQPLAAQYGCGGLRMRLSCDPTQTFTGRNPQGGAQASLVQ